MLRVRDTQGIGVTPIEDDTMNRRLVLAIALLAGLLAPNLAAQATDADLLKKADADGDGKTTVREFRRWARETPARE